MTEGLLCIHVLAYSFLPSSVGTRRICRVADVEFFKPFALVVNDVDDSDARMCVYNYTKYDIANYYCQYLYFFFEISITIVLLHVLRFGIFFPLQTSVKFSLSVGSSKSNLRSGVRKVFVTVRINSGRR